MIPKPLPNISILEKYIQYNKSTGLLYWKTRTLEDFPDERTLNTWNTRFSLLEIAPKPSKDGYKRLHLLSETYLQHRIVWKLHYSQEPIDIDHVDKNRSNNLITNLRSVTRGVNNKNAYLRKDNTSGTVGVYKHGNRWRSLITVEGKTIQLGIYGDKQFAIDARKRAELKYEFHENHGVMK